MDWPITECGWKRNTVAVMTKFLRSDTETYQWWVRSSSSCGVRQLKHHTGILQVSPMEFTLSRPTFLGNFIWGVQRHYYREGSHLHFQTVQNETFHSVPELTGTCRSSFDVKPISSMTSENFSEVSWYSGLQALFVTVFQTSVDFLCKNSYKSSSFQGYFDCFLSNHNVGCCNISFSCLSQIRSEKFCFVSNAPKFLLYIIARLQLSRCNVWPTFHPATPNFLF